VRAVVQRVARASVHVGAECVAEMEGGLLALVGVARGDGGAEADELGRRLVQLRVFEDAEGRMNRSLLETGGTLAVVSQFTLLAETRKGRRPSFAGAAAPEEAEPLIERLVQAAREAGASVVTGRFRAHMAVELVNDGPVTVVVDTDRSG
jgi:D-tyrosyl-tRNA(Tyr) deacylase